jgi:hypothetical protein
MIRTWVERYGYRTAIVVLLVAIVALSGFLLAVALPDVSGSVTGRSEPTPIPSLAPSTTPLSPMANSPIGIQMSSTADCAACHVTKNGTVGTKDIPVMAHPLWGWRDCTACHSTGSLVATAPGHSGLHKDDCLVCHKVPTASAVTSNPPLRPEHMGNTQPCTTCHGVDDHAPLPDSMKGRGDNCWICHNGPEFTYLFESPSAAPGASQEATPSPAASQGTSASKGSG